MRTTFSSEAPASAISEERSRRHAAAQKVRGERPLGALPERHHAFLASLAHHAQHASVGVDIIGRNLSSRRDALILAASLAVGLGIQAAPPGAFDAIPQAIRILVTDGIVMGILLAMFLNIILPKED